MKLRYGYSLLIMIFSTSVYSAGIYRNGDYNEIRPAHSNLDQLQEYPQGEMDVKDQWLESTGRIVQPRLNNFGSTESLYVSLNIPNSISQSNKSYLRELERSINQSIVKINELCPTCADVGKLGGEVKKGGVNLNGKPLFARKNTYDCEISETDVIISKDELHMLRSSLKMYENKNRR